MANAVVKAELRAETGKGPARRLRRQGRVPAVIYGGKENVTISVGFSDLDRLLTQGAFGRLVDLDLGEAGKRTALIKDLYLHPVRGEVMHADFHEVDLTEVITTPVPIQLVGEEKRENDGGVLSLQLRELNVSCLPTAIPEVISVDVSELKIGDSLQVADIPVPDGIELVDEATETVLTIASPSLEPTEEAEAEAEGEEAEEQAGADEGEGGE